MFEEAAEPHWNFPGGIYVVKYDNDMKENGTFTADTATYLSLQRIWRFDRNVRMKNVNGDRFLTQQLFWDQNRKSHDGIHHTPAVGNLPDLRFRLTDTIKNHKGSEKI